MEHEAPTKGTQKVAFSLDGRGYEIDLCAADARKLRRRLQKYTDYARRQSARRGRGQGRAVRR